MTDQAATSFKISTPDRIVRMLRRVCQANLPVLIRYSSDVTVAIKARAAYLVADSNPPYIRLNGISNVGARHLDNVKVIQVEFVMMSTKIQFVSRVLNRADDSLLLEMPRLLYSVERRKNTRYATTADLTGYLGLSVWGAKETDPCAPAMLWNRALANQIKIVDISQTGLAVVTRFPAVARIVRRGLIDDNAMLQLPMQRPVRVSIEVRWARRLKERVETGTQEGRLSRSFRFGVTFQNLDEDARLSIAQFVQQLTQAEAV
jgi:hypothetical protein